MASILSRSEEDHSSQSAVLTSKELDEYHSDVMQLACEFGHTTGASLPVEPVGDAVAIAKQMYQKYAPSQR